MGTKAGLAAVLKMVGGLAAWFGFHERAGRLVAPQRSLSSAAAADLPTHDAIDAATRHTNDAMAHRWASGRFSGLATWSLAAVITAGVAMAALVLESPGELTSTGWGRVLLLKIGAVAVAAGLGAYNHVRLRPALESSPDDPALARELRATLAVESAVLVCVVILTAWLVAAAA